MKRIIEVGIIKLARKELSQVDDPIYSGWVAFLATTVSAAIFNIFLAAFGLEGAVIGEMKQKVSGVIFGVWDPLPGKGSNAEDSNSQDPEAFHAPTTSLNGGQWHQRPYDLTIGEVSVNESGGFVFSVRSSDADDPLLSEREKEPPRQDIDRPESREEDIVNPKHTLSGPRDHIKICIFCVIWRGSFNRGND